MMQFLKQVSLFFLFFLLAWGIFFSPALAATYGSGEYGTCFYGDGCDAATPTPTPSSTPAPDSGSGSSSNSGSSGTSAASPRGCHDSRPHGVPDLFQINRSGSAAKLYFTPVNDHTQSYHVVFGFKEGEERFGGISMMAMNENQGVQSIMVDHLDPKAKYSFKVVSVNGCAAGDWSNWLSVGGVQARTSIFYRYWNKVRNLFTRLL